MPVPATTPQFFQPACLPEALLELYEALVNASGKPASRQAALAIVQEYYNFFGAADMRKDMWLLLTASLGSSNIDSLKKAGNRHNLLFFYEFTLLLFDAVYTLHASDRFGTMSPP